MFVLTIFILHGWAIHKIVHPPIQAFQQEGVQVNKSSPYSLTPSVLLSHLLFHEKSVWNNDKIVPLHGCSLDNIATAS